MFDIAIEGGTIVTMDAQFRLLEDHIIGITDGKISAIFPSKSSSYSAGTIIDASNCLITPGLINAHSHLPMTYFRGLADDLPLQKWLQEYIWPLETKLVQPGFVYDATLHGAAEMIKNGICTTNDMYFHMSSIAEACTKVGLRVIISEALIDIKLDDNAGKLAMGDRIKQLTKRYKGNSQIQFSLAPHSIYTCSAATLKQCADVARENGYLIHTHLSESQEEVQNCLKEHGKKPVEYIRDLGLLDSQIVLAHGIWVDDAEMDILAECGKASIAVCTESNLKLISGFAPLKKYLNRGINLCLGTDGVASNNNVDLLQEASVTAKLHKALNNDPSLLPAKEAFAMVTINGAKAIGKEKQIGSLETGKLADLAIMSLNELENQPMYNPYSHLIYAMQSRSVRDVIIHGNPVMLNYKLCRVDEAEIVSCAKGYKTQIMQEINR